MFSKAKSFFFSNVKTVFRYLFHFIRNKQKFEAGWLIFKAAQGKTQILIFAHARYLAEIWLSEIETECQKIVEISWGVLLPQEL